jgi:hypothetical protein
MPPSPRCPPVSPEEAAPHLLLLVSTQALPLVSERAHLLNHRVQLTLLLRQQAAGGESAVGLAQASTGVCRTSGSMTTARRAARDFLDRLPSNLGLDANGKAAWIDINVSHRRR